MTKTYEKQWEVPSSSDPDKKYKVSLTHENQYECSCPAWTRHVPRVDCKHIEAVRNGDYEGEGPMIFQMIPANVGQVKRKSKTEFLVPLIPMNENGTQILATMIYDLLDFGVPWCQIKSKYSRMMNSTWTKANIVSHVERYGRFIYTEFAKGRGWINLKSIPVER